MNATGTVICLLIMLTLLYGTGSTKWGFFFVWTLFALGVTGAFSAILSTRALWRSVRARASSQA